MIVTAAIPDKLVDDVKHYTGRDNIDESLILALEEWLSLRKIKELNKKIEAQPFQFTPGYSAEVVRSLNRNR